MGITFIPCCNFFQHYCTRALITLCVLNEEKNATRAYHQPRSRRIYFITIVGGTLLITINLIATFIPFNSDKESNLYFKPTPEQDNLQDIINYTVCLLVSGGTSWEFIMIARLYRESGQNTIWGILSYINMITRRTKKRHFWFILIQIL